MDGCSVVSYGGAMVVVIGGSFVTIFMSISSFGCSLIVVVCGLLVVVAMVGGSVGLLVGITSAIRLGST